MKEQLQFMVSSQGVDICETPHVAVIDHVIRSMQSLQNMNIPDIHALLDRIITHVTVILQPHDADYSVHRFGCHVAIDRVKDVGVFKASTRLGVIGITRISE